MKATLMWLTWPSGIVEKRQMPRSTRFVYVVSLLLCGVPQREARVGKRRTQAGRTNSASDTWRSSPPEKISSGGRDRHWRERDLGVATRCPAKA